jgi:hypothetical protein
MRLLVESASVRLFYPPSNKTFTFPLTLSFVKAYG